MIPRLWLLLNLLCVQHSKLLHIATVLPLHDFIALFRYLCTVDSALDPQGSLSQAVPDVVVEEVNREVNKAEARPKKWGQYLSFSTNGVRAL